MKLLLYLLLIHALYCMFNLVQFFFLRIKLLLKIKKFAQDNALDCKIKTREFLTPSNHCGTAVLLKTSKNTYNIRLFGLLRKNCAVHFWNKRMYSVEKYIPRMSLVEKIPLGHRAVRRRRLGQWDIGSDTEIPVLLCSPTKSLIRITQTNVNHIERLLAGDMIEDVLFADSDFLLRYIANRL